MSQPSPGPIADTTTIGMGVMIAYAGAMWQVQVFERNLAILVLALEANPTDRPFKSPEQFRKRMGKLVTRWVNTFEKGTARQLRKRLPDSFDPDLLAEIEPLVAWRDRLAHRYLLEQTQVGVGVEPGLKAEAFAELIELSKAFQVVAAKLHERLLDRIEEFPKSEVPEGVREMFASLGEAIMFGQEFKPPAQTSG
jgi:hypothetical protein